MSAVASLVSSISGYIPAAVKDAAGLSPQISEAVRHITWLSVERVFWPPEETLRQVMVLGYTDGFQIWDLQDPNAAREVVSRHDKALVQAKLLPLPLSTEKELGTGLPGTGQASSEPLGLSAAPLMAYLHKGSPALVRLFSLKAHDDVHLLRLTEPARSLQASRRFFAVGFAKQVELYDALHFQALFSVQCNVATGPTFALGHRWLAYNLPPQQPAALVAGLSTALTGGSRQLESMMKDGLQYLGQVGQRTLDSVLMPPQGQDQLPVSGALRGGIVAVRDAGSRNIIAQFEDHSEPIETMAWDPSGLQLVTCGALGHRILVHRALVGTEHALMMHDPNKGGLELGSVVFQHLYTLSRGYTPAVISDIAVSDDGQLVAVSSAKGTIHVFRLPPLHSAALGHQLLETGAVRLLPSQACTAGGLSNELGLSLGAGGATARPLNLSVCTRIRLGSVLLQEGLMPKCGFFIPTPASGRSSQPRDTCPRMYVATRAGTLALYSLNPGKQASPSSSFAGEPGPAGAAAASQGAGSTAEGSSQEWQATLLKEMHTCRTLRHFTERRLSPGDFVASQAGQAGARAPSPPPRSTAAASGDALSGSRASPRLQAQASPRLGPAPGPRSPQLGPRPGSPGPAETAEDASSSGPSKWLSYAETATHVPVEVPIWMCPQLTFHTYPTAAERSDLKATLHWGRSVSGRRRICISRPERLGRAVRCDSGGASADAEEHLSRLVGGALGTAVDENVQLSRARASGLGREGAGKGLGASSPEEDAELRPRASVTLPTEAWGQLADSSDASGQEVTAGLQQMDGIGACLEEVEEDWLKA
eukprot:TRINITY_DN78087_c0_g1_i1.p1 TRINITY_DN78087_c0_g1~~TRINITY_DN78087_c0_g1_i1.p1  ORF type:complete len:820 (-),score=159.99 TRINITY_DN78087_c0_g1_i1:115-2574(-)